MPEQGSLRRRRGGWMETRRETGEECRPGFAEKRICAPHSPLAGCRNYSKPSGLPGTEQDLKVPLQGGLNAIQADLETAYINAPPLSGRAAYRMER